MKYLNKLIESLNQKVQDNLYNVIYGFTLVIYSIAILAYEMLYCNTTFVLTGQGVYNFSILRSVLYIVFILLIYKFKDYFISSAVEKFDNKKLLNIIMGIESLIIFTIVIIISAIFILKYITVVRIFVVLILLLLMTQILIIYISKNYVKNIILIAATFGLVYTIVVDMNNQLDEKRHFMSAFNIYVGNIDYQNVQYTDDRLYTDLDYLPFYANEDLFKNDFKAEVVEIDKTNLKKYSFSSPTDYNPLLYVPAAIGIFIGDCLSDSIADIYYMGRLANLIIYTVLACIALSMVPFKKNIFFVIMTLPICIGISATYTVDFFAIGLSFIFISYCLKLYNKNDNITGKDMTILALLFGLLLIPKSMAYIFIGFLIFILPLRNIHKNNKYILIKTGILLISMVLVNLVIIKLLSSNAEVIGDLRGGNTNIKEQIWYLIQNPLHIFKIFVLHIRDTVLTYGWWYGLNLYPFSGRYGINIFMPMLIFIVIVAVLDCSKDFRIREKGILLVVSAITFFANSLFMYLTFTEVGSYKIAGYQTRYIIPFFPLILMCCSFKNIKTYFKRPEIIITYISAFFICVTLISNILFHVRVISPY